MLVERLGLQQQLQVWVELQEFLSFVRRVSEFLGSCSRLL
jgi:hypothetical protein